MRWSCPSKLRCDYSEEAGTHLCKTPAQGAIVTNGSKRASRDYRSSMLELTCLFWQSGLNRIDWYAL